MPARCERSEKGDDAPGRAEPAGRIHRRFRSLAVALAVVLAPVLAPVGRAWAGAGEWTFGAHLHGANFRREVLQWGGGGGVFASYGLTDAWALVARAGWTVYAPRTDVLGYPISVAHVAGGGVGAAFALDVLRVVPSLYVVAGAWAVAGGGGPLRAAPGGEAGLAFDYAIDRNWGFGVDLFRARVLYVGGTLAPGFELGVRASYLFF